MTVHVSGDSGPVVLLAHGAGTDHEHPLIAGLRAEVFDELVRPLRGVDVVDLEGADHSFRVKSRTRAEVDAFIAARTAFWLKTLFAD